MTPCALKDLLGDPADPSNPFGWAAALNTEPPETDTRAAALTPLRVALIPEGWGVGGTLRDMGTLFELARLLTRRDPALMPHVMFSIGPLCVMEMAGSDTQRAEMAADVMAGEDTAFALSEPESRSDVMAGTLVAREGQISGKKWLIGKAKGAKTILTLAKTGPGGPVGWSLFLTPNGPQITPGPQVGLTGMRGIDVANLTYDNAPSGPLVGREGMGIELTFRAQGPVKALSVAAALGPCDTALSLAAPFAHHAHQRMLLAAAFADTMMLDALAIGTMRVLSAMPRQFSIWASSLKALGINAPRNVFANCATAMGARSVLTHDPIGALFDKMRRDAEIVRVIDINEVVNLRSVATQLDALTAKRAGADPEARWAELCAALDLSTPAGPMQLARTQVTNMGGERLTESLPTLIAVLEEDPRLEGPLRRSILGSLRQMLAGLDALPGELAALRRAYPESYAERPELVSLATKFLRVHAASAAAALYAANPVTLSQAGSGWLALGLQRLLNGQNAEVPFGLWETAYQEFTRCPGPDGGADLTELGRRITGDEELSEHRKTENSHV